MFCNEVSKHLHILSLQFYLSFMIYFDQKLRAGLDPAHNLYSYETVKRKKKGVGEQENIKIKDQSTQETSQCQPPSAVTNQGGR